MHAVPRPEHPRPDLRRDDWRTLNGPWLFAFDPDDKGLDEDRPRRTSAWPHTINVPFPWQAPLSGIGEAAYAGVAWYRRGFLIPAAWQDRRVWLHFGAVDWHAMVWLNGRLLGEHEGGYTPFAFDITDALVEGEQTVTVRAFDDSAPCHPRGKQSSWYTPSGGIWQTVWLEARPATHIDRLHIVPDPDHERAWLRVRVHAVAAGASRLIVDAPSDEPGGVTLPRQDLALCHPAGVSEHTIALSVPRPRVWHPDTPHLYVARLTLMSDHAPHDTLHACFGMRKIGRARFAGQDHAYITLNDEPIYLRGALDQAFHPQGAYTYPDEATLKGDLEAAKAAGFNFLRLHIKIDEPRLLHWADRLGVLIMADMPNFDDYTPTARRGWEATMRACVDRDFNHPSIFSWCLFNESWGLGNEDFKQHPDRRDWVRAMVRRARTLDSTRLIEDNSPCFYDHVETDIDSWHFYINDHAQAREHIEQVVRESVPGSSFNRVPGEVNRGEPLINSEYGGIGAGCGDRDISWCFKFLTNELRRHARIGGYIYTELMDIEWEHNGVLKYDRSPKVFGYEAVSHGVTLRDLNGADFVVLDAPPLLWGEPGERVEVPALASRFSRDGAVRGRLCWQLDDLSDEAPTPIAHGRRDVPLPPWTVTPLGAIAVELPRRPRLLALTAWLGNDAGKTLARNYINLAVRGELPAVERPTAQQLVLRWEPGAFCESSWPEMRDQAHAFPGKVWGEGAGRLAYRIALPDDAGPDALLDGELMMELAAKAGRAKVTWSDRPLDYPQTSDTTWPSTLCVRANGIELGIVTLPDDPADARGILSHDRGLHHGSHGYAIRLPIPAQALKGQREIALTLEVPKDGPHPGGLAVFGARVGRYLEQPRLVLRLRE